MEQKQYEDTADEGPPSNGGELCSTQDLLPFLEAENQKETVVRLVRAALNCPVAMMPALLVTIPQEEVSIQQKVVVYHSLQALLEHGLEVEPTREFIVAASKQLRAPLAEGPRELQVAASNTLTMLARGHFNPIMTELQRHLRPFTQPGEFTLLTLGRMAATNVYGCIPFLGITLATLQTVVRWIEDGQRRRALCTALQQMCRAIQIYLRSWGKSSYPRISVQRFAGYLFPLYASMARTWLPGSDPQVKLAVLKALSPMLSILLPRREFQAQVYEDLLLLSAQYESGMDPVLVTKLLSQILKASLVNHHPIPRLLVEPLACALSHEISTRGRQPHCRENCAEVSHIFLCLARSRPSDLLGAFQKKLEEDPEELRVTLLLLLSEIVGAQVPEVWSRRQLCVKAVKAVLRDNSAKVRLATLQVIEKLLRMGYLEKVEGWPLNYISLQLAVSGHQLTHPTRRLPLGGLEEKAIERAAMEALHAAVAAKRGTSQALWARLLGYLMQPHYTLSAVSLCQALRLLAEQRLRRVACKEAKLEPVDSPTPQELLARLLSLAVSPLEGSGRGAAALRLLSALRPEIYQDVAEHWWVEVPVLIRYLEGHSKFTLEVAAWEQKLLEFLEKSLHHHHHQWTGSPEEGSAWILGLGQEITKQMGLAHGSSAEKAFLYKALGTTLSLTEDSKGATLQLVDVMMQTDYTDEDQRKGLRWCLASCAKGQLPAVLAALHLFEETVVPDGELEEEPVCLHSSQGLVEMARVKSALLLLYSSTVLRAPREQLRAHLEGRIVPGILRHYAASTGPQRAKDAELVRSFVQSVWEVSLAIQADGQPRAFRLPQKRALLDHLVDVLKAQPSEAVGSPVCQEVLVALRHLSRVPELLCHDESMELAECCLSHVMALPPSGLSGDATQALYMEILVALSGLVETLLAEREAGSAGSEWFQQVFQLLGYWLVSEREWERARAMQIAARLLKARRQGSASRSGGLAPPLPLGHFGRLLGALGPSTCDTLGAIRQGAVECVEVLLSLPGAARSPESKGRTREWWLHCIQRDLRSESAREVRVASLRLAKVVSRALPSEEMVPFLRSLLDQLRTVSAACDQAVLWWFEVAARERGTDLKDKVRDLVAVLCSSLQWAEDPSLRRSLAQALCVLAEHHRRRVCASLVEQPLLQPRARRELWAALVTHPSSRASVLNHLLHWVRADGSSAPSCVPVLLALREVVSALDGWAGLSLLLSQLCHALLCRLSQDWSGERPLAACSFLESNGELETGWAGPRGLAVEVLRTTLSQALPEARRAMEAENTWTFLREPESHLKGVTSLAKALADTEQPLLDTLLRRLLPSLRSSRGASRELVLAFCVELTGHPFLLRRPEILSRLLQLWLVASREGEATVRSLSVRGLGNVAEGAPQEAKKHQEALLAALLQGLGDPASPDVARESLHALGKVWGCLGRRHAGRMHQAVTSQAREYLWHANDALRAAAFMLLGRLAGATQPVHAKALAREVAGHLPALLLHFQDPSPDVAKACWTAFVSWTPFLGLQDLVRETEAGLLLTDASGAWHSRLMGRVCWQLAQRNPALLDTLVRELPRYMDCAWEGIRLAACRLAGVLAETMDGQRLEKLDWEPLLQALQSLCRDSSGTVEVAALSALQIIRRNQQTSQAGSAHGHRRRAGRLGWFFQWRRKGSHRAPQPRPT